jgi:prominin 1
MSDAYRNRIKTHLDSYQNSTILALEDNTALCRPLFDIFDALRVLICHHIIDSINGLWFAAFCCLLLWAIAVPLSLCLTTTAVKMARLQPGQRSRNTHQ